MSVTVEDYQRAERELTMKDARKGLGVHALVTLLVWAVVIPVNVFIAAEFPWSIFVVVGTGIGLFFHWFGYRRTEAELREHQGRVAQRASQTT